jgi:hypothetical protein
VPLSYATQQPANITQLPADGPAEPKLSNINIFLVTASRIAFGNDVKPGVKIDQTRISSETPTHLASYSWEDFIHEVVTLLKRAKIRYIEIREHALTHGERSLEGPTSSDGLDTVTDNLRELAAAANAMQGEHVAATASHGQKPLHAKTVNDAHPPATQPPGIVQQNQLNSNSLADIETTSLPLYTIKTVGPSGWEHIENAEQWSDLLLRRGREVWADGVVNMIVELVDIPADMKATEGEKDEKMAELRVDRVD